MHDHLIMTPLEKAKMKYDAAVKKAEEQKKAAEDKIKSAKENLRKAEERLSRKDRVQDTRRKIIAGALVLARQEIWKSLADGVAEKDRHLFLEIWPDAVNPKAKSKEVSQ